MPVLVKDVMSKPVYKIESGKSIRDAADLIKKVRRGFLVVVKGNKPVGVLSDSDIVGKVVASDGKPSKVKVEKVMTKHFVSISPNVDILTAVRKMKKGNVHRLPVIDKDKLVGVISLTDVARTSPEMLDLLEYRLKMKETPYEEVHEHTTGLCDSCGDYFDDVKYNDGQWLCEDCREDAPSEA